MRIKIQGITLDLICKATHYCPAGTAYYYIGVAPVVEGGDWPMDAVLCSSKMGPMYGLPNIDDWLTKHRDQIEAAMGRLGMI